MRLSSGFHHQAPRLSGPLSFTTLQPTFRMAGDITVSAIHYLLVTEELYEKASAATSPSIVETTKVDGTNGSQFAQESAPIRSTHLDRPRAEFDKLGSLMTCVSRVTRHWLNFFSTDIRDIASNRRLPSYPICPYFAKARHRTRITACNGPWVAHGARRFVQVSLDELGPAMARTQNQNSLCSPSSQLRYWPILMTSSET